MDRLLEVCSGGTPSTPVAPEKPAGSTSITKLDQLISGTGTEECSGGFYLNPDLVMYGNASMGINSKNHSTFSFTFKAADTDAWIRYFVKPVGAKYTDPAEEREEVVVKAGDTGSFTFDCSNSQAVTLSIVKDGTIGNFAEGWITNITLS